MCSNNSYNVVELYAVCVLDVKNGLFTEKISDVFFVLRKYMVFEDL